MKRTEQKLNCSMDKQIIKNLKYLPFLKLLYINNKYKYTIHIHFNYLDYVKKLLITLMFYINFS